MYVDEIYNPPSDFDCGAAIELFVICCLCSFYLLVDGCFGHQCIDFHKITGLRRRIISTDLPLVQNKISNKTLVDLNISHVPHDLIQAQPVIGEKVYYLLSVIRTYIFQSQT